MDETRAVSPPDDGQGDLLDLLDEEIERLPRRYREAVLLCELEGTSRQDAARRLGPAGGDTFQPAVAGPNVASRSTDQTRCRARGRRDRGTRFRAGERRLARAARPLHSPVSPWNSRPERRLPGWSRRRFPLWRKECSR